MKKKEHMQTIFAEPRLLSVRLLHKPQSNLISFSLKFHPFIKTQNLSQIVKPSLHRLRENKKKKNRSGDQATLPV